MAHFDIYDHPFAPEQPHTPFVLDVQNDHLGALSTRVVIPLRAPKPFGTPGRGLNPVLKVLGKSVVLDAASLAPVPQAMLKRPVAGADASREDVLDALDTLFGSS